MLLSSGVLRGLKTIDGYQGLKNFEDFQGLKNLERFVFF